MSQTAEKIILIIDELIKQSSQLNEIFSCNKADSFAATDWQKINKGL